MRSIVIENYKQTLSLTKRQEEILIGMILGDGHLEKLYTPELSRLKVEHSYKQKDYVDWLYQEFKNWVRTEPKVKIKKVWGKIHTNYGFTTYGHKLLGNFQNEFYDKDKKKVISISLIKNITPLVLAIWYMDDGSVKSSKHKGVFLNTQSFNREGIKELQNILEKKFGISSSTRKDETGEQIYLGGNSGEKFIRIIESFVIPSLKYKIPRVLRLTELPKNEWRRLKVG